MRRPGDPRVAARVRAARAYAGMDQAPMAEAIGHTVGTYKRMEQGSRLVSASERRKIADVTGVPLQFMEDGFDALLIVTNDLLARRVLEELRDLRGSVEALGGLSERTRRAVAEAQRVLSDVGADNDPAHAGR